MSVNSRFQATKIKDERKAFHRQRIPGFSSAGKETVDIDVLVTSRNGDRPRVDLPRKKKEVEPVDPVLKNIYQSYTYRKDLGLPHFDDEPRVQEKKQVNDQQSCIFVIVACLTIPSSNYEHQPRHDNSIPYMGI